MGLLVRFEDKAVPFVLAALKNVARQVPVGGQDGIMVANAISAVEGGKDEAEGHVIGHVPLTGTVVHEPFALGQGSGPVALPPAAAAAPEVTAPAEPAPLTPDQEYEAQVAAAGEEYNRLLLAAQARLNAAHTAQRYQAI